MEYPIEKKSAPGRKEVEVLGKTYEKGEPKDLNEGKWRKKVGSREEMLRYLATGERYWYGDGGFGSERRKNPA